MTYLYASNNQLRALPALPAGLTYLEAFDNQLTALPALPAGLTHLEAYFNQLTALPALPAGLTYLYASNNQLTALPALPAGLTHLYASDNQLTALPALPAGLTYLDAFNNQLRALPTLPAGLTYLDAHNNQLRDLPALPAGLTHLYASDNQLRDLPALPAGLTHLAANNQLNESELPLSDQMTFWMHEYHAEFPDDPQNITFQAFLSLSEDNKTMLSKYLQRLREIKDYNTDSARKNSVQRVFRMLYLAETNESFREDMLGLLTQANASCGDRVLLYFNEIEILWQWFQVKNQQEARDFAIRSQKYFTLQAYASQEAEKLESLREEILRNLHAEELNDGERLRLLQGEISRRLREESLDSVDKDRLQRLQTIGLSPVDEIEMILALHLKLKELLNLPISTQGMLYPGCSHVTDEMTGIAFSIILEMREEELLAQSEYWQKWITKNYPKAVEDLNDRYESVLQAVDDYLILDDMQKRAFVDRDGESSFSVDQWPSLVGQAQIIETLQALQEVVRSMPHEKNPIVLKRAVMVERAKKISQIGAG